MSDKLNIEVDNNKILDIFKPYVTKSFLLNSEEWHQHIKKQEKTQIRRVVRRKLLGWIRGFRRTQNTIEKSYSYQWESFGIENQLDKNGPVIGCQWGDNAYYARAVGTKRIHLYLLIQAIEKINPTKILEVGFGNGLNLFILSNRFPNIEFSGVELTEGGVKSAMEICREKVLPGYITDFSPCPLLSKNSHNNLNICQGSAASLQFEDNSYDLVFTCLALEQMEEIRCKALEELVRVSSGYIVMIEPFRDWNNEGIRRNYIIANDYFEARTSDLKEFGLEVVYSTADFPHKSTYSPGIVIARKL